MIFLSLNIKSHKTTAQNATFNMKTYSEVVFLRSEFTLQQRRHVAASDGTPRLINIYSEASEGASVVSSNE